MIYAPAIILSSIKGWSLFWTNISIGGPGHSLYRGWGNESRERHPKTADDRHFGGMFLAAPIVIWKLPSNLNFGDAMTVAGKMGKLNGRLQLRPRNRYTFWSGMLGGVFLFLSYFGTDQSQGAALPRVNRSPKAVWGSCSTASSRCHAVFGAADGYPCVCLLPVFSQPLHFNTANVVKVANSEYQAEYQVLRNSWLWFSKKKEAAGQLIEASKAGDQPRVDALQAQVKELAGEEKRSGRGKSRHRADKGAILRRRLRVHLICAGQHAHRDHRATAGGDLSVRHVVDLLRAERSRPPLR